MFVEIVHDEYTHALYYRHNSEMDVSCSNPTHHSTLPVDACTFKHNATHEAKNVSHFPKQTSAIYTQMR